MKIPKIIHQVYEDADKLPDILRQISETWKVHHQGWEFRLWDKPAINEFLKSHYPDFMYQYMSFPYNIQRWHTVRYLILYHFGGVYADMDYECLESLDDLFDGHACCWGLEPVEHAVCSGKSPFLGNALFASVPAHSFLKHILDEIRVNSSNVFQNTMTCVHETTGMKMLNKIYELYRDETEITLLPESIVSPLSMLEISQLLAGRETIDMERKIEVACAIHYFLGLWRTNQSYREALPKASMCM